MPNREINEVWYGAPSGLAETEEPAADGGTDLSALSPTELSAALLAPVGDGLDAGWASFQRHNANRHAVSLSDFAAAWCPDPSA
jgi:hypothetical protein